MILKTAGRYLIAAVLLVLVAASSGCESRTIGASALTEDSLNALVKPYQFDMKSWEAATLIQRVKDRATLDLPEAGLRSQRVVDFFQYQRQLENLENQSTATSQDQKAILIQKLQELRPQVEAILAGQISGMLAEEGIFNPLGNAFKFTFPPVSFDLESNLNILIISPRESIQRLEGYTIKPDISTTDAEKLEGEIQANDLSALVIPIGGLGAAYPSFVIETSDLRYTLNVVTEEWLHQYLAFTPLGFRYVLNLLGMATDKDIPTINETVAGMASKEIGDLVYERYYEKFFPDEENGENQEIGFDFNAAMRETRLEVDRLLGQGNYQDAESYMEQRRVYINAQGYNIRKLNQAYFAFYGSYADSPTSVDPIGGELKLLRKNSTDLQEFLNKAAGITGRGDLEKLVTRPTSLS
jgi:hypothetical protein